MKVRITYTVEIPDHIRRAMNDYYGKPGLATRKEIQSWYRLHGETMDDDLSHIAGQLKELEEGEES